MGDGRVEQFSAVFARSLNQIHIVGGNHNKWKQSNMFRQFGISHLVSTKRLGTIIRCFDYYVFLRSMEYKISFESKKFLLVSYVLAFAGVEVTFAKTQIMNGIEQIGFSCPIFPDYQIYFLRERKVLLLVIFEVANSDGL